MGDKQQEGATPPDGGRTDHESMRQASERPLEVEGAAATDTLAASGGLEVPGRLRKSTTPDEQADQADAERNLPPTVASIDKLRHREDT